MPQHKIFDKFKRKGIQQDDKLVDLSGATIFDRSIKSSVTVDDFGPRSEYLNRLRSKAENVSIRNATSGFEADRKLGEINAARALAAKRRRDKKNG